MQEPSFKKKMVDKYRLDTELRTLKNHIIYVIHLHLAKHLDCSNMFTDEESADMDIMINAIPYFEHLAKNYWTIQDIESGLIHQTMDVSIKKVNFNSLESRVIKQLSQSV
jgi:hypothetical protein